MSLHLFNRRVPAYSRLQAQRRRPVLESLEGRVVLSAAAAATAHVAAQVALPSQAPVQSPISVAIPLSLSHINLTQITRNATTGALTAVGTATGSLLGHTFTTPVTATLSPPTATTPVPVLHLALNEIHLNLLGVKVDTSKICLNVVAHPGPGNLLGNLVSDLSGVLNSATSGGSNLSGALGQLTSILNGPGLLGDLNNVLASETSHAGSPTASPAAPGSGTTTPILNLSIAPVDLNLLGLEVKLDNCANGPVTVAVSAVRGSGNLLGNLLSSVAHLLDSPGHPTGAIQAKINHIVTRVENALA